jgi:hypothetical protein
MKYTCGQSFRRKGSLSWNGWHPIRKKRDYQLFIQSFLFLSCLTYTTYLVQKEPRETKTRYLPPFSIYLHHRHTYIYHRHFVPMSRVIYEERECEAKTILVPLPVLTQYRPVCSSMGLSQGGKKIMSWIDQTRSAGGVVEASEYPRDHFDQA